MRLTPGKATLTKGSSSFEFANAKVGHDPFRLSPPTSYPRCPDVAFLEVRRLRKIVL